MSFVDIFINKNGLLRSGWRVAIFILLFMSLSGFLISTLNQIIHIFYTRNLNPAVNLFIAGLSSIIILIPLSIWMVRTFDKMSATSLGFQFVKGLTKKLLISLLVSLLISALVFWFLLSIDTISFSPVIRNLTPDIHLFSLILWLILVVIVDTFSEEFFFRGYLQQTLARGVGLYPSILITALIFVCLKIPDIKSINILETINLILMSMALSLAMFKSASIWVPCVMHAGWDLLQTFAGMKGFDYKITSLPYLIHENPGIFYHKITGIDGSISGTIGWIVIIAIVYFLPLGKSLSEHWWQFTEIIHSVNMRVWDFCINNHKYFQWKIADQDEAEDEEE